MIKRFLLGVLIILVVYVGSAWGIDRIASLRSEQIQGIVLSGIIATLNVVAAFVIILWSVKKEAGAFSKAFLTGIAARMFILLAVIFFVIKFSKADHLAFLTSLFILYFLYQIWELIVVNNNFKQGMNI